MLSIKVSLPGLKVRKREVGLEGQREDMQHDADSTEASVGRKKGEQVLWGNKPCPPSPQLTGPQPTDSLTCHTLYRKPVLHLRKQLLFSLFTKQGTLVIENVECIERREDNKHYPQMLLHRANHCGCFGDFQLPHFHVCVCVCIQQNKGNLYVVFVIQAFFTYRYIMSISHLLK